MITKGNITTFSFYVAAFDTKNSYRSYGESATQLSLEQAKEEFAKRCAQNPLSVNTVLGVDYSTNRRDLDPHGMGSADLLQCINGHLRLSDDYKLSEILSCEKLITVNAMSILEREAARLQRISDNATAKCAKIISERTPGISSPEEAQQLMYELSEEYGLERCKDIIANELLGNNEISDTESAEYLNSSFSGKYDSRFAVFASAEQLEMLAKATKQVEDNSLSDSESKLRNSGLVYGNHSDIHDRSAEIKTEILHHNDLEDEGLAADDQLSL